MLSFYKPFSASAILVSSGFIAVAQPVDSTYKRRENAFPMDKVSLGFGGGLDYGGFGVNLIVYPKKNIGLFAGLGHASAGTGFNAGVRLRATFNKNNPSRSAYLIAMYGYNTSYKIAKMPSLNKLFYGYTFGIGFETPVKRHKAGVWSFSLLKPIRTSKALDYDLTLAALPGKPRSAILLPLVFSLGFKFILYR